MSSSAGPAIAALRQETKQAFGRELTEEQLAAYRGRLPTMIRNVRLLAEWAPRLRDTPPALIQRMIGESLDG